MAITKSLIIAVGMLWGFGVHANTPWDVSEEPQIARTKAGEGWVLSGKITVGSWPLVAQNFVLRGRSGERVIVIRGNSVLCEETRCTVESPRLHRSGSVIYAKKAEVDLRDGRVTLEGIGPRSSQEET